MATSIRITPPGGITQEIHVYDSVRVSRSSTNRSGTYSIQMRSPDSDIVDAFPIGSVVEIEQDGHKFRGWVLNPAKRLSGPERTVVLEGPDYSARTQKIVVAESYINERIDTIVRIMFGTYAPWALLDGVEECPTRITVRFSDMFLWTAMETICELSGYEWYIDYDMTLQFFKPADRINPNILKVGTFHRGSANLKPDSSQLVNRLWVKGGKALSDNYVQPIIVNGTEPIQLYYTPRATTEGVIVIIDGQPKTIGIQYLHDPGGHDFLLNYSEKLLIPDLCTSGSGTITYRYEYPIKILLEDPDSQSQYGVFEDVHTVETTDRVMAREIGLRYLYKYNHPVMTGGLEPFKGVYHPGELVKVEIPELKIDEFLKVKSVQYMTDLPSGRVRRRLELETPERDLTNILKEFDRRLRNLEKEAFGDDEIVERYVAPVPEEWGWSEGVQQFVYACPVPRADEDFFLLPPQQRITDGLFPKEDLYPC